MEAAALAAPGMPGGIPEVGGLAHPIGRGHSTSCKFSRWSFLQVLLLCGLSERPGRILSKAEPML